MNEFNTLFYFTLKNFNVSLCFFDHFMHFYSLLCILLSFLIINSFIFYFYFFSLVYFFLNFIPNFCIFIPYFISYLLKGSSGPKKEPQRKQWILKGRGDPENVFIDQLILKSLIFFLNNYGIFHGIFYVNMTH